MDIETIRVLVSVHYDDLEIEWIPYDPYLVPTANFSIRARSIQECLVALGDLVRYGRYEVMEGTHHFYFWCKFTAERE